MEPTFRAPRGPRDLIAELPPEHRDVMDELAELHQAKTALIGIAPMESLGTFGGAVSAASVADAEIVTISNSSFAEGMRYVNMATSGRDSTPQEQEKLRRGFSHIANYAAAGTAHLYINALSETARLPIEEVRQNLDDVDWRSVATQFIKGFADPEVRKSDMQVTDELRALPVTDGQVASFSFLKSMEYSSEATMLLATALLSNHKKTAVAIRNALYGESVAVPKYNVRKGEQGDIEFVNEHDQPIHITDFLHVKLRQSVYAQAVIFLDGILGSKEFFATMSVKQRRVLDVANRDEVWLAFADCTTAPMQEGTNDQFTVDEWVERPLFPGSSTGESREVSSEQIERELASIPSAYVDRSRLQMLDEMKTWTRGVRSIGTVFGGKGARRVRDTSGELVEDKYFGAVLPIYNADDTIRAHYLVAESVIAGRNVTIVYRSDVGGLPWEQVAELPKREARDIKGVRFLSHTKVGDRSVAETTQEKVLYLFTCSAEEYERAEFSGETAKGELRVRVGRTALRETVDANKASDAN